MTDTPHPAEALGHIMGRRTRDAVLVAQAFTLLLPALCDRESPQDWDVKPVTDACGNAVVDADGRPRTVKVFPESFMRRLVKAHAAGAFEHRTPKQIAERILTTDEPAEEASCAS